MTLSKTFLRKKLLKNWPYPCAKGKMYSLSRLEDFCPSKRTLIHVGGQLGFNEAKEFHKGRFFLQGQGKRISFDIGESPKIPSLGGEPLSDFFECGDFVGIEILADKKTFESPIKKIEDMVLLSPKREESPYLFDFSKMKLWKSFLNAVREYFLENDFLEVETPTLVPCPGMDSYLHPFEVRWNFGKKKKGFYLITSPELHLKKYLSMGLTDFFEITRCYRNEELSETHQPEFWMAEWYRAYANLERIQKDLLGLLQFLNKKGFLKRPLGEIKSFCVKSLFEKHLNFSLKPETSQKELYDLCIQNDLKVSLEDTWVDLFSLLFISQIEPHFKKEGLFFVHSYPPQLASLSRVSSWAHRLELYWGSMELANAFEELNDPEENEKRYQNFDEERRKEGRKKIPEDEGFFQSLFSGMPPSSGVALGLERLFLSCQNLESLDEIRPFPVK